MTPSPSLGGGVKRALVSAESQESHSCFRANQQVSCLRVSEAFGTSLAIQVIAEDGLAPFAAVH